MSMKNTCGGQGRSGWAEFSPFNVASLSAVAGQFSLLRTLCILTIVSMYFMNKYVSLRYAGQH